MSRNIRKKTTKALASKKVTTSSRSSPASSDDGYGALDDMSDSDDEEPDVEAAEEQAIIESIARGSDDEEDADDESNDDESNDEEDDAPQRDQDDDENESFNGFSDEPTTNFFNDQIAPTTRRRVHFDLDEVDYSSNSDSDSGGSVFPDLLAEEDLDPKFRQLVQDDNGDDDDGSETFWDWDNPSGSGSYDIIDDGENAFVNMTTEDDDSSESGYSTDEGETTEEELPAQENVYVHASRTMLRRDDESSSDDDDDDKIAVTPRLGTWYPDGTKSFALTDHDSQRLMVFVAKTPQRRHSYDGTPFPMPTAQSSFTGTEPFSDMSHSQMIISTPENVMLGAGWIDSSNNGFIMSPEALTRSAPFHFNGNFGMPSIGSQGSSTDGDFDANAVGEFNFDDFVHHDSDDSGVDYSTTEAEDSPSTSRRLSTAISLGSQDENSVSTFLSHLQTAGVGSFRRNQNHHRLMTRHNESYESLAFSGPIHEGTLRGVKQGKLAAVNTPMTPLRKAKVKFDFTPVQDPAVKRKREVIEDQTPTNGAKGHKRTRSMA